MINIEYFIKGALCSRKFDSPAIALGASFMTSDAGKVYMILQSALSREFGGGTIGSEISN